MNKKWRLGIVGAGSIVESVHIPVLKSFNNLSIAWIFDANKTRLKQISSMYNLNSIESLNDKDIDEIDCCLIAIPVGSRSMVYNLLRDKNKKIYVEKPFALTKEFHEELILTMGGDLHIGFQRRFYPWVEILRSIINSKLYGNLKQIRFSQGVFNLKGGNSFIGNKSLAGGGVIIESAIHGIDIINFITCALDVEVGSFNSVSVDGLDYHSQGHYILSHDNNPDILVEIQISCLVNFVNGFEFEFETAKLFVDFSPSSELIVVDMLGQSFVFGKTLNKSLDNKLLVMDSFKKCWKLILSEDKQSQSFLTNATSSLLTTKLIEDLYKFIK